MPSNLNLESRKKLTTGKASIVADFDSAVFMKRRMNMKRPALLIVLLLLGAVAVHAQTPYYQGKTIRIVTGYPAGDVNDLWPRLIAQHMTQNIFPATLASSFKICPGQAP